MHNIQIIEQTIRDRSNIFEENFRSGNAQLLVEDYYVPDSLMPVVSSGDGPAIVGRASIVSMFDGLMASFSSARQVPHFIRASEELAYEISNSYLTPKDGGEELEFRYLATWRRCEDTWRVEADFFALGPVA